MFRFACRTRWGPRMFSTIPSHSAPFTSSSFSGTDCSRGRILGRNPDQSFPPCYSKSPLPSFALRFIFLQNHATSYSFYCALLYTWKEKGGKPDRKPHLLPYGLKNSIHKPHVWELLSLWPETSKNTSMNSAFGHRINLTVLIAKSQLIFFRTKTQLCQ